MRPLNAAPLRREPPLRAPKQAVAPRRDPAPSRVRYRMQRLWLTPAFRSLTRIGAPVIAVVLGLGLWLGDEGRRADLVDKYDALKVALQNRPEFMISLMKVEGANPEVDSAIRAMLPVKLPASSFTIDLEDFRDTIRRLDAVADVKLVIRPGGVLEASVTERLPSILWRTPQGVEMLDDEGHRVATLIERSARPDLPLIAGAGADRAVPEALAVLAAAAPILSRARGLLRVGERRWDLILDRDQRIMLPEKDPVGAIDRILALDSAEDILDRDFTRLDMRNEQRPTIRLSTGSLEEFRRITGQETKVKAGQ